MIFDLLDSVSHRHFPSGAVYLHHTVLILQVAPHAPAEQQRHIALVLRSAFRFVDHHPYLVQLGGFDCLFRILSGTDDQAREEALYTLHDLVQRYPMDANLFQVWSRRCDCAYCSPLPPLSWSKKC